MTNFEQLPQSKQTEIAWAFMNLYRSNPKGHGVATRLGAKFDVENNKKEISPVWARSEAGLEEWLAHLRGDRMLGLGPILDDDTCWWASIDLDHLNGVKYEFDYVDEMAKIKSSGYPLLVDRSKSGGLHLKVFFSEPLECSLVRRTLKRWASSMGYADNTEIFPKQDSLHSEEKVGNPSWMYMPYGPTWDLLAEQCGMSESAGSLGWEEYIDAANKARVNRETFNRFASQEQEARNNGARRSRKHGARWKEEDTKENTIRATFCDGPPCLWDIAHKGESLNRHDFLFACAKFFKWKYTENWEEALAWANYNLCRPAGDNGRLGDLIRDCKKRDYEYRCHDLPIVNHCNPFACAKMTYGVGKSKMGLTGVDLAMTIINRVPAIYIVSVGDKRVIMSAEELLTPKRYRVKCLEYGVDFPSILQQRDWDDLVNRARANATIIEPGILMKTDADLIELFEMYFSFYVASPLRAYGDRYLKGYEGDTVRYREQEECFYFKWDHFRWWCVKIHNLRGADEKRLRMWVNENCEKMDRTATINWLRSKHRIHVSKLDNAVCTQLFSKGDTDTGINGTQPGE